MSVCESNYDRFISSLRDRDLDHFVDQLSKNPDATNRLIHEYAEHETSTWYRVSLLANSVFALVGMDLESAIRRDLTRPFKEFDNANLAWALQILFYVQLKLRSCEKILPLEWQPKFAKLRVFDLPTFHAEIKTILKTIDDIPEKEREEIFYTAAQLGVSFYTVKSLSTLSPEKRAFLVDLALPLLTWVKNGYNRADCIEVLSNLIKMRPEGELVDIIEEAIEFYRLSGRESFLSEGNISTVIEILTMLPANERKTALPSITSFFDRGRYISPVDYKGYIKFVESTPREHRSSAVDFLGEFFSMQPGESLMIHKNLFSRELFTLLLRIPPEKRTAPLMNLIATHIMNPTATYQDFQEASKEICQDEPSANLYKNLHLLFLNSKVYSGITTEGKSGNSGFYWFEKEILNTPRQQLDLLFSTLVPFADRNPQFRKNLITITMVLQHTPEDCWATVLNCLVKKDPLLNFNEYMKEILTEHPEINEKVHQLLINKLDMMLEDRENANMFATVVIIKHSDSFLLQDDSPLFIKALEVSFITEDKSNEDLKNPYKIHHDLREAKKGVIPAISAPVVEVFGEKVSLDLAGMRRAAPKSYTFADLPQHVAPDDLRKMFQALRSRIEGLNLVERGAVQDEINQHFGQGLDELEGNLFLKATIPALLQAKGEPNEQVSPHVLFLNGIVAFTKSKSPVVEEDKLLSPREDMLLRASASISGCGTGQKDGIVILYDNITREGDGEETSESKKEEGVLVSLASELFQRGMQMTFSSEAVVKEFVGDQRLEQMSHQTLYLKNRLHPIFGFQHVLTFDPGSHCLFPELIEASDEALAEAFLRHFPCEVVIRKFHEELNKKVEAGQITWSVLYEFMEKNDLELLEFYTTDFDSFVEKFKTLATFVGTDPDDSNFKLTGITEKGTLKILQSFGYLQ